MTPTECPTRGCGGWGGGRAGGGGSGMLGCMLVGGGGSKEAKQAKSEGLCQERVKMRQK